MSTVLVTLPKDYALVAATAIATGFLNSWQGTNTSKHRRISGVSYPAPYADNALAKTDKKAHNFNCAQRAHLNTLEHLPTVLAALLWTGIRYPRTAAALGGIWIVGRILYTLGYSTGNPSSRNRGAIHYIGEYGLYLTGLYAAYEMFTGAW